MTAFDVAETPVSAKRRSRTSANPGAALPSMQAWAPELRVLLVEQIVFNPAQPRGDAENDLDGLVASLDISVEPHLVQPPTVEELPGGETFLVQMGERRIRSVIEAGWRQVACLVVGPTEPFTALLRRLAENMQRRELHPLDEAASIKNAWLYANAVALGGEDAARAILAAGNSPLIMLDALTSLLAELGFVPTHPLVTRQQVLARLGLAVTKDRLKQILKVLALDNAVLRQVRDLDMTEAAIRSLATLEPEQQSVLVAEIASLPPLGRQVRWIAVNMRDRGYSFDDALEQAKRRAARIADASEMPVDDLPDASVLQGIDTLADTLDAQLAGAIEVKTQPDGERGETDSDDLEQADPEEAPSAAHLSALIDEDAAMERVLSLLEAANTFHTAGADLLTLLEGQALMSLPEPWREYALSAAQIVAATLKSLPLQSSQSAR